MKMLSTFFQQCLSLSLLAAKKAGEAILEVYQGDIHASYKNDKTPLTLADETAHKVIGKHLSSQALKEIPVLSEEGKLTPYNERKAWEYFWILDPLDGTKEFIKRKDLAKHYVSIIILACLPCPHRQANAGIQKAWIQGNEQENWIPDQVGNDNTGISTTLFDFLRNYQSSCASWFNFSYPAPGSSAPNRLYPRWQETASVLRVYRQAG